MIIFFSCDEHCQDFYKTEEELQRDKVITHCPYCGKKLHISNLDEIVAKDLETRIKENIDKWFNTLGIEGTVELIERNNYLAVSRLYQQELHRRGVIKC
jgi:hypothetical protein